MDRPSTFSVQPKPLLLLCRIPAEQEELLQEALEGEVDVGRVPDLAAAELILRGRPDAGLFVEIDVLNPQEWELMCRLTAPENRRDGVFAASLPEQSGVLALKLLGLGFDVLAGPDELSAVTAHHLRRAFSVAHLRRVHRVLATAVEAAPCGVAIADASHPDFPLVYVNDNFTRVTGYSREESLGRNCRFLQGDLRSQPELAVLRTAVKDKVPARVRLTNFRRNGLAFVNELHLAPVRDEQDLVTHFVGVQHDVTERETAREGERRFRGMAETAPIKIWELDGALQTAFLNNAWGDCLPDGVPAGAVDAFEWVDEADSPVLRSSMVQALESGRPVSVEAGLLTAKGERRIHRFRFVPRTSDEGQVAGLIGTATDVTEQKASAESTSQRLRFLALQTLLMRRLLARPPGDPQALGQALGILAELGGAVALALCPLPAGVESPLTPKVSWPNGSALVEALAGQRLSTLFPFAAQTVGLGTTVARPTKAEFRRFQAVDATSEALLIFPIRRERVVVGCLFAFGASKDPKWSAECSESLSSLCQLLEAGC